MIRIGVLGTANIAYRRMIPAINRSHEFEYVGVAVASCDEWTEDISDKKLFKQEKLEKTNEFVSKFGGRFYEGYEELLKDESIDAVYISLPPSLHEYWSKMAIIYHKYILVEKPFLLNEKSTKEIIDLAEKKNVAYYENYGFVLHSQFRAIKEHIQNGDIGEIRLLRAMFTFHFRGENDFRYKKEYGGGAFFDCGGYVIKATQEILENGIRLDTATLHISDKYEVDMYGDCTFTDSEGHTAQLAFGMDNAYNCQLEVIESKGSLVTNRAYTAPNDYDINLKMIKDGSQEELIIEPYDQFLAVTDEFANNINNIHDMENIKKK